MFRRFVLAAVIASALGAPVVLAQPAAAATAYTWTGADAALGNRNWSNGGNWAGGVAPPAGTPVDIVVSSECVVANCNRSINDINGIVVEDFVISGGPLVVEVPVAVTTFTLSGGITVTDNGRLGITRITLAGPTTNWTLDGGSLTIAAEGGAHVAVSMANGASFTPAVLAISTLVTGVDPSAAPTANGTVSFASGRSPMLLDHVAAIAQNSAHNGHLLTDSSALHLGVQRLVSFPNTDVTLADLYVQGAVVLDPDTTVIEEVLFVDRSGPPFPGVTELRASHIAATGPLSLNNAKLQLDMKGACVPIGRTATVAQTIPNGLSSTFADLAPGSIVIGTNPPDVCSAGLTYTFRIFYDNAIGRVWVQAVGPAYAPTITVATSRQVALPGQAITYTAQLFPAPYDGGTLAFLDDGTPIAGCTAQPVSSSTGMATCTTSYATPGSHFINAFYNGSGSLPPSPGPSPGFTQEIVPAPTATITSASGLSFVGTPIQGTASDAGGPGLLGVVLYYHSYTGGPSGAVLANCASCGAGQTSSTWSFTPGPGSVPGIYSFVAQAFDVAGNASPASNVVYQIILPALL